MPDLKQLAAETLGQVLISSRRDQQRLFILAALQKAVEEQTQAVVDIATRAIDYGHDSAGYKHVRERFWAFQKELADQVELSRPKREGVGG